MKIRSAYKLFWPAIACSFCWSNSIPMIAQEPDYSQAVQDCTELIKAYQDGAGPLKQIAVYKWANGATQQQVGQLVLYLDSEGRPAASSKIAPNVAKIKGQIDVTDLRVDHVTASMAKQTLEFKYNEKIVWQSPGSGIEFQRLDDASIPASTESRRLTQAKSLARDFTASIEEKGADFFSAGQNLRLLPTPVYRYGSQVFAADGTVDGHLLLFVLEGGSPPILLLLEAVRTSDQVSWQFAVSRRGVSSLTVKHQGEKVWEVPRISDSNPGQSLFRVKDPR